MIHKLIYTSAEKGLQPGSRGFCTVATTPGIPRPLIQALESLSTYRHVFSPGSGDAGSNPSVFSCLKMQAGPSRYTVLSRIEDAGSDYTGRSNFLARHLALETSDQVPAGPAWLMTRDDTFQTEWHGPPQILDQGKPLPAGRPPAAVCRTWQQIAGDAGWAGALAQTAMRASKQQPVSIIVRPDMPLLELYVEALRLLPDRWSPTFSTYFTKLPPGVGCDWRMVWQDSPEAAAAKQANHLIFDLCGDLGSPPPGPLVDAARSGEPVGAPAHMPAAPRGPAMPAMPSRQRAAPAVAGDPFVPTAPVVADQEPEAPSTDSPSAVSESHLAAGPLSDLAAGTLSDAPTSGRRRPPRRPHSGSRFLIWLVVILSLAATGALGYLIVPKLLQRDKDDKQPEVAKTNPSDTDGGRVERANGGDTKVTLPQNGGSQNGGNPNTHASNGAGNPSGTNGEAAVEPPPDNSGGNGTPATTVSTEAQKALANMVRWQAEIATEIERLKPTLRKYSQLNPQQKYRCLREMKRVFYIESFRKVREFDFRVLPPPKSQAEQDRFTQLVDFKKNLKALGDQLEVRENGFIGFSPFVDADGGPPSKRALPDAGTPITVLPLRLLDWRLLQLEAKAPAAVADAARPEFLVEVRGGDGADPTWNIYAGPAGGSVGESIGHLWLSPPDFETELKFSATPKCSAFDLEVSVSPPFSASETPRRRTIHFRTQGPVYADVNMTGERFLYVQIPKERIPAHAQTGGQLQVEFRFPKLQGGEDVVIGREFFGNSEVIPPVKVKFWERERKLTEAIEVSCEMALLNADDALEILVKLWFGRGPLSLDDLIERFQPDRPAAATSGTFDPLDQGGQPRQPENTGTLGPDLLSPEVVDSVRKAAEEELRKALDRKEYQVPTKQIRELLLLLKNAIEAEPATYRNRRETLNQGFAYDLLTDAGVSESDLPVYVDFVREMKGPLNKFGGEVMKRHNLREELRRQKTDEQFYNCLLRFKQNSVVTGALKWRPSDAVDWKTVVPLRSRVRNTPPAPAARGVQPDAERRLKVENGPKVDENTVP